MFNEHNCYVLRGLIEQGAQAHLLIPPGSRPDGAGRRTSSQPGASGPAPGPSWLLPPGPAVGRPRAPHKQ